jgi:hypothetical protein
MIICAYMKELIIKMPKKRNMFTGRCCLKFDEFETFKELVNIGELKIIHADGAIRVYGIEAWMVDHAYPSYADGVEFMLVTFSKSQYTKDKLNEKKFGSDYKRS